MRSILMLLVLFGVNNTSIAQTEVHLFSGMDGMHIIEDGSLLPIWGYGYIEDGFYRLPSPTLRFDVNEEVEIYMTNLSPEGHTIHLHGLDVDQMNDGVPHTSEQIFPDDVGMYAFASTYPGTYFYHCHVTTTLHLTMGMYGLVIIEYPNNQVSPEAPAFDHDYPLFATDLEIAVNQAPFQAFPFHEIRTDYFMLNGLSGTQITEHPERFVWYENGETALLRLSNLGYSLAVFDLPEELNAVVYTSDGRVLPEPFQTTSLEVYPGERFSLLIQPNDDFEGDIAAHYYSMINKEFEHTNLVPVRNGTYVSINERAPLAFSVFPNPATNELCIASEFEGKRDFVLYDSFGRVIEMFSVETPLHRLDVSGLTAGCYLLTDQRSSQTTRVLIH